LKSFYTANYVDLSLQPQNQYSKGIKLLAL
jgi:hypothetical protein